MKKNKIEELKEIKYYDLDGKKYFFSDKNLVKNNEDNFILLNAGEETKKISLVYASTDYFMCSNLLEKFRITSEELENEFPKARRALFLYEVETINNNDDNKENMESNNEVS